MYKNHRPRVGQIPSLIPAGYETCPEAENGIDYTEFQAIDDVTRRLNNIRVLKAIKGAVTAPIHIARDMGKLFGTPEGVDIGAYAKFHPDEFSHLNTGEVPVVMAEDEYMTVKDPRTE